MCGGEGIWVVQATRNVMTQLDFLSGEIFGCLI